MTIMKSGPSNDDDEDANTEGSSISHICGTSKKSSEGSAVLLPLPTDETLGLPSLPADSNELTRRNRGDDNWQKGIGGLLWPLGSGTDVPAKLLGHQWSAETNRTMVSTAFAGPLGQQRPGQYTRLTLSISRTVL